MPFADQVPINSPHSTMHGGKWVVLIARSTGSALRAVCPFQPSHHAGWPARSRLRRQRDGFFVAFAAGHHGPGRVAPAPQTNAMCLFSGSSRMRLPVAAKMALASAGGAGGTRSEERRVGTAAGEWVSE